MPLFWPPELVCASLSLGGAWPLGRQLFCFLLFLKRPPSVAIELAARLAKTFQDLPARRHSPAAHRQGSRAIPVKWTKNELDAELLASGWRACSAGGVSVALANAGHCSIYTLILFIRRTPPPQTLPRAARRPRACSPRVAKRCLACREPPSSPVCALSSPNDWWYYSLRRYRLALQTRSGASREARRHLAGNSQATQTPHPAHWPARQIHLDSRVSPCCALAPRHSRAAGDSERRPRAASSSFRKLEGAPLRAWQARGTSQQDGCLAAKWAPQRAG